MLEIAAAIRSERGQRAGNEDQACVCRRSPQWLGVLADGAGGHQGGEEASRRAVDHLSRALYQEPAPFDAASLTRAVVAAHHHVRAGQDGGSNLDRMHTTVVVLWIDAASGSCLWTHVGDSRLYLVRRGVLRQLTADDSVVQRMVEAGVLTPQEALVHPYRNQLLAALGIAGEVEPHTANAAVDLQAGDAFLLCTDGWWGSLEESEVLAGLAGADTPEEWLAAMQRRIEARAQPGQDNFSAIAAWVVAGGGCAPA